MKVGAPDLERGGHGSLGLARSVIAGGDFAARFVELGLHVVGQFEVVFDVIFVPRVELFQFRPREPGDGGFNFLNCAQGGKLPNRRPFAKPVFLIQRQVAKAPRRGENWSASLRLRALATWP